MNVLLAVNPGLSGGGAILDERGGLIACFDLPTIGEGAQRRVDAANLADLIREHGPYAFAIVNVPVRAGPRENPWRHRGAGDPGPPCVTGEVEKGARPQQRRQKVTCSRD